MAIPFRQGLTLKYLREDAPHGWVAREAVESRGPGYYFYKDGHNSYIAGPFKTTNEANVWLSFILPNG